MPNNVEENVRHEEAVIPIPLSDLHPFPDHPFKVRDDDAMKETVESVMEYGILTPAIVRPRTEGGYEIVAGHRRRRACELAGLDALPSIIRDMDNDIATILMVDSNIQRENILPSEKAKAYQMKMEAICRKAGRPPREEECLAEENCGQRGHNFRGVKSRDLLAENSDDSARTIQRYLRLNELSPRLRQMVDDKKLALTPAVELSYLQPVEQQMAADVISRQKNSLTLAQAQQLKKLSQSGGLNEAALYSVMRAEKPEKESKRTFAPKQSAASNVAAQKPEPKSEPCPALSEVPFKLEGKRFDSFAESVAYLKDTEKDCSCTPDIFLATITEFVKKFQREVSWYSGEYYSPVFPALTPLQLDYLRQQLDTICSTVNQYYENVKG